MGKKKSRGGRAKTTESTEDLIWVDPSRVRFQHSRIRPYFSGCGRSVQETLDAMRQGKVTPSDIPPIQVIVGPATDDDDDSSLGEGPWYFSLNNRRLWVFKRLREEGLLPDNKIAVRVRPPKSEAEKSRYSLDNCALEAKLMREGGPPPVSALPATATGSNTTTINNNNNTTTAPSNSTTTLQTKKPKNDNKQNGQKDKEALQKLVDNTSEVLGPFALHQTHDDEDSSDESSIDTPPGRSNPFSVLG